MIQTVAECFVQNIQHQEVATAVRCKGFGEAFRGHASELDDVLVVETGKNLSFVGQFRYGGDQITRELHPTWIDGFVGKHFRAVGMVSDHINSAVGSGAHVSNSVEFIAIERRNASRRRRSGGRGGRAEFRICVGR